MPSNKKDNKSSKKVEKGSVGVVYGGLMKSKGTKLFWSDESEPKTVFEEACKFYGQFTRAKYVVCEDAEKVFGKIAKKFADVNEHEDVYESNSSSLIEAIKEESKVSRAKTMGKARSKTSKEANASDDDASGDDASGDESEDEKPKKVDKGKKETKESKSGKKAKKDESEDEASDDGSGDESVDASGDDASGDESVDEAPKKSQKKTGSSSKKEDKKEDKKSSKKDDKKSGKSKTKN